MNDEVTPDGSPVPVYLALPARDEPEIIDGAVLPGSRILELGCGVGRLTRVLIALGHRVTAVDESAAMLAHVTGARTVRAPIAGLWLGERFDAVVLASHLINADPGRAGLLATCAAHVQPGGGVLVQRLDPAWSADPTPGRGRSGPVTIEIEVEPPVDGVFAAVTRYTVGSRSWEQPFRFVHVPDELLEQEAEAAGLRLAGWADGARTWAVLAPRVARAPEPGARAPGPSARMAACCSDFRFPISPGPARRPASGPPSGGSPRTPTRQASPASG